MISTSEVHRPAVLTVTRPNTTPTYGVGDIVGTAAAGAFEWTNFLPGGTGAILTRLSLTINSTTVTAASFRVHFWDSNPALGVVDDALMPVLAANVSKRIGFVDLPAGRTGTGATGNDALVCEGFAPVDFAPISFPDISGTRSVWVSIEARAAYVGVANSAVTLAATLLRA
jgi:hypothetical protein